jgi:hypothetical protein
VLDDVIRHLGSEVEFAEGERVMDNEAQNRFNRASRTATEVGQFSDLCNLSTVADFDHVERNHIANELVLQPSRGVQLESTEVAFKDLHRGGVGGIFSVTVEGADSVTGFRRARRTSREDKVSEATLATGAKQSVIFLARASLFIQTSQKVLDVLFGEVVTNRTIEVLFLRHLEVRRDSKVGVLCNRTKVGRVRNDVSGSSTTDGKVLVETTGQIRLRTSVLLSTLRAAKSDFNVTLEHLDGLSDIVRKFILNASDVSEVERHRGHTDSSAEHLGMHRQFVSVLLKVTVDGVLDIVFDISLDIDIGTIDDTARLDGRQLVNLPAEVRVARLGTLLRHGGEGRVSGINEGDKVSEVFSLTRSDIRFSKDRHVSNYRNFLSRMSLRSSLLPLAL